MMGTSSLPRPVSVAVAPSAAAAVPRVRDHVAAAETASPDDRPPRAPPACPGTHQMCVAKARVAAPMDVGPTAHEMHASGRMASEVTRPMGNSSGVWWRDDDGIP